LLGIFAAIRESVALTATVSQFYRGTNSEFKIMLVPQSAVFLLILAIPQIVSTVLFLHQYEAKSGQEVVETQIARGDTTISENLPIKIYVHLLTSLIFKRH